MGLASAALVLALGAGLLAQPSRPPDHTGYVVYYNPGVMEGRARANDPAYETNPAPCYVAYTLAHDRDMGRLWLRIKASYGTIRCLVVDLPDDSQGHRQPLIRRRVWAELGYKDRWICGEHWSGRAKDCPSKIWVERR